MTRIRLPMVAILVLIGLLGGSRDVCAQPRGYEGYQVLRITVRDRADCVKVRHLQSLGHDFQVWSEVVTMGRIEARVAPRARPILAASGLTSEVVVSDLQQHIDALYTPPADGDFFGCLRKYDEHVQFMNDLAAQYPDLAEVISLGDSVQGRPLWALHITGTGLVKPGVLYHGAEHGNEQAPASLVNYVAQHLLANYDTDPEIRHLVDHIDWYLLPIMNPDGYVVFDRYNAHGVDLNRNWDGPGSGEDPWGGPYPFSEPETCAVRDFFDAHPTVRMYADIHGYVPWLMWPWAHIPDHCPHHETFAYLGGEVRDHIAAAGGGWYETGTIYDVVWYGISGCSTNYAYGELVLWAFAFEVVDDDMPEICEEFLDGLLFLGQWIQSTDCNGNGVDDAEDIAAGTSSDCNANGVPDECEEYCLADVSGDCTVDVVDLLAVLGAWGETGGQADVNFDGITDVVDLLLVLSGWGDCA